MGSSSSKKASSAAKRASRADNSKASLPAKASSHGHQPVHHAAEPPVAAPASKSAGGKVVEPFLQGNQWIIENVENSSSSVDVPKRMQAVALYACKNSEIHVNGKCASVQIAGVNKSTIYVENVVGSVEISNCKSVKIFVSGLVPCFTIDKCDGVLITLSQECVENPDFMIVAANSSEMNCAFEFHGEMRELPIPEQFVHKLDGDQVDTQVSSLYSA